MTQRPKYRYLVSARFSDFVEADSETEALDALADRLFGGDLHVHEIDWAIEETESTDDLPE